MPGQRGHPDVIPAGHHMVCPTCQGGGRLIKERALLVPGPRLASGVAGEHCRPCEGTGWIPPKHPEPSQTDEPDAG